MGCEAPPKQTSDFSRYISLAGLGLLRRPSGINPLTTVDWDSESSALEPSQEQLHLGRDMTMHQCCAILGAFFGGEYSYVKQGMPLRKPGFCRELSLNVVVYRVKSPAQGFLYCTPR
jgi:hypothetical protein